jgi:hypothetical protein
MKLGITYNKFLDFYREKGMNECADLTKKVKELKSKLFLRKIKNEASFYYDIIKSELAKNETARVMEKYNVKSFDDLLAFYSEVGAFYIDTSNNMRVIMLNAHTDGDGSVDENGYAVYNSMKHSIYGTELLDWLVNVALANTDGKRIILSAHPP